MAAPSPSVFDKSKALELLRRGSSNHSADFRDGQLEAIQAVCKQGSRVSDVNQVDRLRQSG